MKNKKKLKNEVSFGKAKSCVGISRKERRMALKKQKKLNRAVSYARANNTNKICINHFDLDNTVLNSTTRLFSQNNETMKNNARLDKSKKLKKKNNNNVRKKRITNKHSTETKENSLVFSSSKNVRLARLQEYVTQESKKLVNTNQNYLSSRNNIIKDKEKLRELNIGQSSDDKEINKLSRKLHLNAHQKRKVFPGFAEEFGEILKNIDDTEANLNINFMPDENFVNGMLTTQENKNALKCENAKSSKSNSFKKCRGDQTPFGNHNRDIIAKEMENDLKVSKSIEYMNDYGSANDNSENGWPDTDDGSNNSKDTWFDNEAIEDNDFNESSDKAVYSSEDEIFESGSCLPFIKNNISTSQRTANDIFDLYSSSSEDDTSLDGFIVEDDYIEYEDDEEPEENIIDCAKSKIIDSEEEPSFMNDMQSVQYEKQSGSIRNRSFSRKRIISSDSSDDETTLQNCTKPQKKREVHLVSENVADISSDHMECAIDDVDVSRHTISRNSNNTQKKKKISLSLPKKECNTKNLLEKNNLCVTPTEIEPQIISSHKSFPENKDTSTSLFQNSVPKLKKSNKTISKKKHFEALVENGKLHKSKHKKDCLTKHETESSYIGKIPNDNNSIYCETVFCKNISSIISKKQDNSSETMLQSLCKANLVKKKITSSISFKAPQDGDGKRDVTNEYHEDIYGRLRDKSGRIVQNAEEEANNKYISPGKMSLSDNAKNKTTAIQRQLQGILNRLTESNIAGVVNEFEGFYNKNGINTINDILTRLLLKIIMMPILVPKKLVEEHALLVAVLSANIGSEVGGQILTEFVVKWNDELKSLHPENGNDEICTKELENLLFFICSLYNFKVVHSDLIFDTIYTILERGLATRELDHILLILRSCGFFLRKESSAGFIKLISYIKTKSSEGGGHTHLAGNFRHQSMMKILIGISCNNMSKIPNYDPSHTSHLRTLMKGLIKRGSHPPCLNISLKELLTSRMVGKWWVVGSAWSGASKSEHAPFQNCSSSAPLENQFSDNFKQKAAKLHMTRFPRINILYIITEGSEGHNDAFEKLLQLKLPQNQEKEIFNIIVYCLLRSKTYTSFYGHLGLRLCRAKKSFKRSLQYAIWDQFQELNKMKETHTTNFAKFLSHLIVEDGLNLTLFKALNFAEADEETLSLLRQTLILVLLNPTGVFGVSRAFDHLLNPKEKLLRQYIRKFIAKFINPRRSDQQDTKVLQGRVKMVLESLSSVGGVNL